jgi:hypothetical protein
MAKAEDLLSPQEPDNEFGLLSGGSEAPSAGLDGPLWMHALSPGWRPVPCIESDQGISGPAGLQNHGLARKFPRPESYSKLLEPQDYLASLSASMPRRIAAVIKNGGDMTKY